MIDKQKLYDMSLDDLARYVGQNLPGHLSIEDRTRRGTGSMGDYALLHSPRASWGEIKRLPHPVTNMSRGLMTAYLWGMLVATNLILFPAAKEAK